ncbi:hypothetical protein N7478_000889 [Penicillium angulare]|uniref:uncharacterized protein n=1 Tax=Penicillium angulare TaxID=116970 RepID=UPI0025414FD4|nr:uncharacterized protein N7478_000889 [Penicillium angulare]KAJ5291638.1 hypothetical protein N7478_000889 [Penicillium angulare]
MLQIESLGEYFSSNAIYFDRIFASDLSRAHITAAGICNQQPKGENGERILTPIISGYLRERSFGSLEGKLLANTSAKPETKKKENAQSAPSNDSSTPHVEIESVVAMRQRAISFLNEHILPSLFECPDADTNVAIVSHGAFLRVFWNRIVELFDPTSISIDPNSNYWNDGPAAFILPSWSNTGFLQLSIQPGKEAAGQKTSDPDILLKGWAVRIVAVDRKAHLEGLQRTRGGIGSATHDSSQKKIDQFFKN